MSIFVESYRGVEIKKGRAGLFFAIQYAPRKTLHQSESVETIRYLIDVVFNSEKEKKDLMHPYLYGLCDQIDACVFSGDNFLNKENRDGLREYIGRWEREINRIELLEQGEVVEKLVSWGVEKVKAERVVKENYRYCSHLTTISGKADFCRVV